MKQHLEWKGVNGRIHSTTVGSNGRQSWRLRYPHLERRDRLADLDNLFARQQTRIENQLNARLQAYEQRLARHRGMTQGDQLDSKHIHTETDIERRG